MKRIFSINSKESTIVRETAVTGNNIIRFIRDKYADANLEQAAKELCDFLRVNGSQDLFDVYRTAERALYPDFGAVGYDRKDDIANVLYFWVSLRDLKPGVDLEEVKKLFAHALYHLQRERNLADPNDGDREFNPEQLDDKNQLDQAACTTAIPNTFAEVLTGKHKYIKIDNDIYGKVHKMWRVLVAIHLGYAWTGSERLSKEQIYQRLIGQDAEFNARNISLSKFILPWQRSHIVSIIVQQFEAYDDKTFISKLKDYVQDEVLDSFDLSDVDGKHWSKEYLDKLSGDLIYNVQQSIKNTLKKHQYLVLPGLLLFFRNIFLHAQHNDSKASLPRSVLTGIGSVFVTYVVANAYNAISLNLGIAQRNKPMCQYDANKLKLNLKAMLPKPTNQSNLLLTSPENGVPQYHRISPPT